MSHSSVPKRVLVIDGGCLRGLGCLLSIEHITKKASEREGTSVEPYEIFDLICGSGVGGLVAILLGRLGMDCQTAITTYKRLAKAICGDTAPEFYEKVLETNDFFDSTAFETTLHDILRDLGHSPNKESMITTEDSETGTKTLITAVHNDSNRVYPVRSYPAPKSTFITPPRGHDWTVDEAIKASLACPFFLAPLVIDGHFTYSEAGFAGFNNPINQAYQECEKLWGSEQPILCVSLGTALGGLAPEVKGSWLATDHDAAQLLHPSNSNIPNSWSPSMLSASQGNFIPLVKRFATVAVETRKIALKVQAENKPKNSAYHRLDPPLALQEVVFCDVYYDAEIRKSVNDWVVKDGLPIIKEIVSNLVPQGQLMDVRVTITRAEMEAKIKEAQTWEVPKPLEGTVNPGYNPELDRKRPTAIDEYLKRYDVLFVIDDSGSMKGGRWKEARDALKGIAEYALQYHTDTIEVIFLNSTKRFEAVQGSSNIQAIFDKVSPQKGTPTGECLRAVIDGHITKLDRALGTSEYSTISPLDIIVITDGRPTDNPAEVMKRAVARMKQAKHHPNCIGVQFVQIGNDSKAKKVLEGLVHGDNGSMVDTVPYNGVLTAERLARILLGGLHPNVRAMITL